MNNLDFIDLGLPSGKKWMKCNLGASSPKECGDYYMWGSTIPNTNDVCDWAHAPFNNGSTSFDEEYFNEHKSELLDENGSLKSEYDAVYQATNGVAHMPTKDDFDELLANTTSEWAEDYDGSGVNGRLFTSNTNGNSIFIPASGYRWDSSVVYQYCLALLWSSSLYTDYLFYARELLFNSDDYCSTDGNHRYDGLCMRGVSN